MSPEYGVRTKKQDEGDDTFMVSFASLMILLLTFMILMVTLAQFKEPRFRQAIGSVKGAFSFLPHTGGDNLLEDGSSGFLPEERLARATMDEAEEEAEPETAYGEIVREIRRKAGLPDLEGLMIEETPWGLTISISDALMFERGGDGIRPTMLPVLDLVADAIKSRPGKVSVVGNTCDLPIDTYEFPSNWELSILRAVSVIHRLETAGVPAESLFAYGLADQSPVARNDGEEGRSRNRRVEIYIAHASSEDAQGVAE